MGVFRIPAFNVRDEDLASVLKSLAGKAIGLETPQPVLAQPPKANGVEAVKIKRTRKMGRAFPEGTVIDLFLAKLKGQGRVSFTRDDVNKYAESKGLSRSAAYYAITKMLERRIIRSVPTGGYELVAAQPEQPKEAQVNV